MGLFDIFRRGPRKPADRRPAKPDLTEARCCHYVLAHIALRSLAFDEPLAFLGMLASPDASRFLANVVRSVTEQCREREPRPDLAADDLTVHKVRVGRYPCVAIEFPAPRAITEVYFVAAVLLADPDEDLPDPKNVALRYFTLEKGTQIDGTSRTVFCEWTAEGTHHNFGSGPAPQLGAFTAGVGDMLK